MEEKKLDRLTDLTEHICEMVSKLVSDKKSETESYNPKLVFKMPSQPKKDARKTLAYMDLPNVVNMYRYEKGDAKADIPPQYIKILLEKYVFRYKPALVRIFFTEDYGELMENFLQFRTPDINYVRVNGEPDVDAFMINELRELKLNKTFNTDNYARFILFTGDSDFYESVGDLIQYTKVPTFVIGHRLGFSTILKSLTRLNKDHSPHSDSLLFTYRYYYNKDVEQWYG